MEDTRQPGLIKGVPKRGLGGGGRKLQPMNMQNGKGRTSEGCYEAREILN